jgi:hypothetical protein
MISKARVIYHWHSYYNFNQPFLHSIRSAKMFQLGSPSARATPFNPSATKLA